MENLFLDISEIKGIGPKKLSGFHKLGIYKLIDILFYEPKNFELYPIINSTDDLIDLMNNYKDQEINISIKSVKLTKIFTPSVISKKKLYIVNGVAEFLNFPIEIIFFHINSLRSIISFEGIIRGKSKITSKKISFTHPDFFVNKENWSSVISKYFLSEGIYDKDFTKIIKSISIPNLQEWIPEKYIDSLKLPSWKESIYGIHFENNQLIRDKYIKRLAFDELIFQNIISEQKNLKITKFFPNENLKKIALEYYEFELTKSQKKALQEIETDLKENELMIRLLHGDVGSGKTIIAFLSMLNVINNNNQIAFIAPTEVLTIQHYNNFKKIIDKINFHQENIKINCECIIGSTKNKEKQRIKEKISNGMCNIIFGTHSLFEENVQFINLNYVVIDEQHKFGVKQKLAIISKGKEVNILIMSATPIPRTLEHSITGSIKVSKIEEKIPGRIDVKTYLIGLKKTNELINYIGKLLQNGENGYWVCPSIEENEDMSSVNESYKNICEILKNYVDIQKISILHGKMKPLEKNQAIENFKKGEISLLISTTIIEIGVDVPSATFIVIENAERFGLSQLHQLRGRIGRNNLNSSCFLVYKLWSPKIKNRLNTIKNTNNGFEISQKDLEMRGSGEFYGYQQSGIFEMFNFVDYEKHKDIIEISKHIKKEISDDNIKILKIIMEKTKIMGN